MILLHEIKGLCERGDPRGQMQGGRDVLTTNMQANLLNNYNVKTQ